MTPPNTDPLEAKIEQTFLDRILLIDTEKNILGGESDRNAFVLLGTPKEMMDELLTLLQQEKKEAERLGRIKENTYHWHRQKAIEAEAKNGGVSGYFLTRNEELQQPPNTEQEQS